MNAYEEYGRLMIQAEIVNNKIQEVKARIAREMSAPKKEKENGVDGDSKPHRSTES